MKRTTIDKRVAPPKQQRQQQMADSDDSNSYGDRSDDSDSGYGELGMRTRRNVNQCECTDCWLNHQSDMNMNQRLRAANDSAEVSDLINLAYNERNQHSWHVRNVRDEADPEASCKFASELESRLRHPVMEHRGFCVSFSRLDIGLDVDWSLYSYESPMQECDYRERKTQKCIETGLWNDTVRQRYVQLIDDFKTHIENIFSVGAAFPRFHALISAACRSSQLLLCQPYSWNQRANYVMTKSLVNLSSVSKALSPASSVFTEIAGAQRVRLLEFSGMTGKLITRMMCGMSGRLGTYEIPNYLAVALTKYALHTTRRVHCTNACEILVGNRYIIHESAIRHAQGGVSTKKRTYRDVIAGKPARRTTYLEALSQLRILYDTQISNLMTVAKQVQGGLSVDLAVNSNDQFLRLNDLKIVCGRRLMNMRNEAEDLTAPEDDQFQISTRTMRFVAEFPKLFSYEISRLFGAASLRLYVATIEAQLRLAKQGCYAAMLSFAKLEPRMVDAFLCPIIARKYGGLSEKDKYNHVASKDEVLGPLLLKYRHHIPRTAHVVGDVCRIGF